jgi:Cu(I)/Ag(I) efflux system membrane fusion protein
MKILLILLLAFIADAKILEVKQLFNLKTIEVQKHDFGVKKSFYGKTAIDESRIHEITLRYDAFVNRLYTDELYKYVKKGDKLFNLYSQEVSAIHEEYLVSKSISARAKKSALLKLKLLNLQKLSSEKKPAYAFDFISPYSGYVIEKNILDGGFIKKGKTALKIADFSKLWIIAKVYQKDIAFIKLGMKTEAKIEGFDSVKGVVDFIYPSVDTKDQSISVRILIDNPDLKYFPSLFAKVQFEEDATSMLQLPKTAVLKKADKYYVFVPIGKEGQFEPKEISAKRVNAKSYEILSGLSEGDKVIDNALFMLDSDAVTNALYESEDDDW